MTSLIDKRHLHPFGGGENCQMRDDRHIRRIEQSDADAFYGMKQREFNKDYYKVGAIDARVATVIKRHIDECIERGWDTVRGEIY